MQSIMNVNVNKLTLCLSLIFIATGIERFWGNFDRLPTLIKILFSCLIYFSFFLFSYRTIRISRKKFNNTAYWLLFSLVVFIVIGLFQGLNYDGIIIGNKYITLFFKETAWMILFPPLFAFLVIKKQLWYQMWKLVFVYAIYATICLLIGKFNISCSLIPIIPVFYYYCKGFKRLLLIATFIGVLITGFSGARTYFVLSSFAILSIFNYYLNLKKWFLTIYIVVIFILPFGLFTYSLANQTSVFELMSNYSSNENLVADTRTFLYKELAEDLTTTDSWFTGKSVIGRYFSPYFFHLKTEGGDSMWRIGSEVTILNFLLKEGLIYVIIYLLTFIIAIHSAINQGRNRFVKSIAIMLSGIYFNLFIGDMLGCNLFHLCYWLMIGTCFSKKWLNMTDQEVKMYFKQA